jgi:oligopeptide transport system permease protein
MLTVYVYAKRRGYPIYDRSTFVELMIATASASLALMTPLIIVGGIVGGFFTPTEASVVAVLYSLILGVAVYAGWLPAGGWDWSWQRMVLPVVTLALPVIAYIARLMRGSMIEVLHSNFIRTARAKGLPEHVVIRRHALKPAILPVISYMGPATAALITGSVVIERIYSIPGLGSYFVQGALNRDYTLVMGVVVFYGIVIIVLNFIVDLLYAWLNPRIRFDETQ